MASFSLFHWVIFGVIVFLLYRLVRRYRPRPAPPALTIEVTTSTPTQPHVAVDAEGDADAWEGSFWEVVDPRDLVATLEFDYVDGAGRKTHRAVDVRQFGAFGPTVLLIGRCSMRKATRTFRVDRMSNCIDVSSGELIDDIATHLRRLYEASPARGREHLIEAEYDTLRVLLYVGKADGQLRAAEKDVIRRTAKTLAPGSTLTDDDIDRVLADLAAPTIGAFKLAVGRLAKREPSIRQAVVDATEAMIGTQKSVHQAEQEALDYMRKRFATAGNA